eukprot:Skav229505  [mRNA]  locus=scaffold2455:231082:234181:- [translate_table: standard]
MVAPGLSICQAEPKAKVKKPRPLPPPPPPALATAALLVRGAAARVLGREPQAVLKTVHGEHLATAGPCGGELQPIWVSEPNCSKITLSLEGSARDPFPKEDGHNALLVALEKETNQLANAGAIAVFEMDKALELAGVLAEAEQKYGEAIYEPKSQRPERLRLAHDCGKIEFLAKEVEAGSKKKPDTMIMAKKKQVFVKFSVEKGDAAGTTEMTGEAPSAEAWLCTTPPWGWVNAQI